ncbi:DUF4197 domain-containing protein [Myroides ceti]|uniref:DUF4197 domain-containing protein n=1 Tax=Paenimyroides ceti TaxID=395087 RepID=A0ABT8CTQ9_9FLAO|nr:DUF4197 domain-containing protein [Paenimyroides ceti]MDN3707810.1 DUF4197 domain-containing protein [Paenimyroides ceti]MDN3709043.1 DUF4197 domain-containing protein [Paenimyroides ceti]
MKKIVLPLVFITLFSCTGLQQIANQIPELSSATGAGQTQIANGLKEALKQGVDKQVSKLTKTDGFFGNPLVKIGLPPELEKVEKGLRTAGLGNLADEGIKALNRAAEDAVKEATPIFINAITSMTIADASNILMGNKNAATQYLEKNTSTSLYTKFNPVIKQSFNKVGADKIWKNLINNYNTLPMVKKVNPDLTDYVTKEALNGVFMMIEKEELNIRNNVSARSTDVLKSVFALQDKK